MDEAIKAAIAVVGESLDAAGCTPDPVIGGGNEGRVRVEVRILRGEPWWTVSVYGRLSPRSRRGDWTEAGNGETLTDAVKRAREKIHTFARTDLALGL